MLDPIYINIVHITHIRIPHFVQNVEPDKYQDYHIDTLIIIRYYVLVISCATTQAAHSMLYGVLPDS